MFTLLEFIFQGFFEWVYSLILDIWNYFTSSLLGVMSLDFAYLKSHIPVMGDIQQILLAVGWALLLGNLVFQALRSMASGLGFEGEDPKLLFARTFVFGFLLLASPQICETVLGLTSKVIALLEIPDAVNVHLVDSSFFGALNASWLLVIIFDLIAIFMVLSLLLEVAERYMVLAMLTITAPLAFAMGGSKSTSEIFAGWCRMYGSMCLLMATNIIFFKMLLSVVSTIPSGLDGFLWMVLIMSIVKVAKKADEIITRIGLNPAITGNKSTLPGVIAYTVFRTALSIATKGAADGISGALGLTGKAAAGAGKSAGAGKGAAGTGSKGRGKNPRDTAGPAAQAAGGPRYGGGRTKNSQNNTQQEQQSSHQKRHSQRTTQQSTSQTQTDSQRQTTAQERTTGSQGRVPGSAFQPDQSSRKTSVQSGTRRGSSYVTPPDSQHQKAGESISRKDTDSGLNSGAPSRDRGSTRGRGIQDTPRGRDFTGTGASPRASFDGTHSKTTQKTEISQSGTAGTGIPSTTRKQVAGAPAPQSSTSGTRSTQRSPVSSPQQGRSTSPTPATPTSGAQKSTSVRQELRQADEKGRPSVKGRGSAPFLGTAGARNTQRPLPSGPRHSKNMSPTPAMSTLEAQTSSPVQQEPHQTSEKGQPPVKDSRFVTCSGTARAGTRSTQRPPHSDSQHSKNMSPIPAKSIPEAQSSSPVQQGPHRTSEKDRPSVAGGSVSRPGITGPGIPSTTGKPVSGTSGAQLGTAEKQARSTQRHPTSEPRHSRNTPLSPAGPPSGTQSSSPAQQGQCQASRKGKTPVKDGDAIPRPGTAGIVSDSRTPPGQKLGGGPSKQKPTRQTKREGDSTSV